MSGRTRRSIVFQLWAPLSAITVAFTLVALAVYLWLAINDSIDEAQNDAAVRAAAVYSTVIRLSQLGEPVAGAGIPVASSMGVEAMQFLDGGGNVLTTLGNLDGAALQSLTPGGGDRTAAIPATEVEIKSGAVSFTSISPLDLLQGGEYGAVLEYPSSESAAPGGIRLVMGYHDISGQAQTLLFRSLVLTGGILAVAVIAMWLLLNRFVAQPLRDYSQTAMRIAMGEPLRMPDLGNNALGQLGQAINGMAEILRHQATVDSLTGLYNHRHLNDRLEDYLGEARRNHEPLSLIVCDLDNLKPVNDTYGHQVGDLLLKTVARHLLTWAGIEYTCWRTGGDEFAAVIPGASAEVAFQRAAILEESVNRTTLGVPGGALAISLSIGIASYPEDGATGEELMNVADRRMYDSKAGKARASLLAAS